MQWTVTAAEIDGMRCNRLQRLCKFLCFVCAFTMDVSLPHPTVKPRFLVSKSAIKKLVLIYIHKKDQKISTLQLLIAHLSCSPVMFSFLSCSLWRHIYHTRAGTCAHVHLFSFDAWRSKRTDTKTWRDTSTSSTHHHDESLLL